MKINTFEGARRITKLAGVLWVVGVFVNYWNAGIEIPIWYRIDSPNASPIRMNDYKGILCDADDAAEYFHAMTSKGTNTSVALCFKPMDFDNGRRLIPYQTELDIEAALKKAAPPKEVDYDALAAKHGGVDAKPNQPVDRYIIEHPRVWGNDRFSTEVVNYTKQVANRFRMSKADEEWVDRQVWPSLWEKLKEGVLVLAGGLVALWGATWVIGWIVRGFLGI